MYPLFNLLMPCPNEKHYATSIKMRPSTGITTIGTLRYLNQNEQHYTTLHYATHYSTFGNSTKTTVVTSIRIAHSKWEVAAMVLYTLQLTLSFQRTAKWARLTSTKMRPCEHEWAPQTDCKVSTSSINKSLQQKQTKVLAVSMSSPNRHRYSIEHVIEKKESRNVPRWRRISLDGEKESANEEEKSTSKIGLASDIF